MEVTGAAALPPNGNFGRRVSLADIRRSITPDPLSTAPQSARGKRTEPELTTYEIEGLGKTATEKDIRRLCHGSHVVSIKPDIN
jgi:hypothetical protein